MSNSSAGEIYIDQGGRVVETTAAYHLCNGCVYQTMSPLKGGATWDCGKYSPDGVSCSGLIFVEVIPDE